MTLLNVVFLEVLLNVAHYDALNNFKKLFIQSNLYSGKELVIWWWSGFPINITYDFAPQKPQK